jgi:hypothetical protein
VIVLQDQILVCRRESAEAARIAEGAAFFLGSVCVCLGWLHGVPIADLMPDTLLVNIVGDTEGIALEIFDWLAREDSGRGSRERVVGLILRGAATPIAEKARQFTQEVHILPAGFVAIGIETGQQLVKSFRREVHGR